jgi:hypothetical protein
MASRISHKEQPLNWLSDALVNLNDPWPQAFATRAALRLLPLVGRSGRQEGKGQEIDGSEALSRYLYCGLLYHEDRYRVRVLPGSTQRAKTSAIETVFNRHSRLVPDMRSDPGRDEIRLLVLSMLRSITGFIRERGDALGVFAEFGRGLRAFAPISLMAWNHELENDWHWCHPLGTEDPGNMAEFLTRPLWEAARKVPDEWEPYYQAYFKDTYETPLARLHQKHTLEGISMDDVRICVMPPAPVSDAAKVLAGDPGRLAGLLARISLQDRTRLSLVDRPTFSEFREAAENLGAYDANGLVDLEQKLPLFEANGFWRAWLQTVHGDSLIQLRDGILEWTGVAVETPETTGTTAQEITFGTFTPRPTAERTNQKRAVRKQRHKK